jgi:hypothetical protein
MNDRYRKRYRVRKTDEHKSAYGPDVEEYRYTTSDYIPKLHEVLSASHFDQIQGRWVIALPCKNMSILTKIKVFIVFLKESDVFIARL